MTVSTLRQNAFGPNYLYLKILQKYRFDSNDLHYIFEGDDDQSFYFNFLQVHQSEKFTYISRGKNNSIDIYDKIDWSVYEKKRILIFIDKDYSRILGEYVPSDKNIYETTYYSIENYISNSLTIRRLINEVFHYYDDEVVAQIQSEFESQYEIFFKSFKPIIAWILIVRSHAMKANLNQIDLNKLFEFDKDLKLKRIKTNKVKYLERVTQISTPKLSLSEVRKWYQIIEDAASPKDIIRGKYDMWYLVAFFKEVKPFLKNKFNFDTRVKTNINLTNAIEIIGPRIIIPIRLERFLKDIGL